MSPQALIVRGTHRGPIIITCPESKLRYMLSIGWRLLAKDSDVLETTHGEQQQN